MNDKISKSKQQEVKPKADLQIQKIEKELDKLHADLKRIEEKLANSEMYQSENKKQLNEAVEKQKNLKEKIAELEKLWLEAQK